MKKLDRVGEEFTTTYGQKIKIVEYFGWDNSTVKFADNTIVKNVHYRAIVLGNVRNPNYKGIYGVGFMGEGVYGSYKSKSRNKFYLTFKCMMERSFSKECKEKYPTYKDVTVCEEWHNFQNFAKWMEENYNPEAMEGWHLDKDILVKGNKIYSPETCCFIPREVNTLLTKSTNKRGNYPIGVSKKGHKYISYISRNGINLSNGTFNTQEEAFQAYKIAKENYIKEVADKWKDLISEKVYQALMNYQVEITD